MHALAELNQYLDNTLGPDWPTYELETILYDFPEVSTLLVDEIGVLRNMRLNPELFWKDVMFFLHAVVVMSGEVADFDNIPNPDSTEVAWALMQAKKITGVHPASLGVKLAVLRSLENDGYSETLFPFTIVAEKFPLAEGQLPEDTAAKKEALEILCSKA